MKTHGAKSIGYRKEVSLPQHFIDWMPAFAGMTTPNVMIHDSQFMILAASIPYTLVFVCNLSSETCKLHALRESERGAADVAAALGKLGDSRGDDTEASFLELSLELRCTTGHNDGFAGADKIAGEGFDCFLQ